MAGIVESITSPEVSVSIELFPPKGEKATARVLKEIEAIHAGMDVAFTSVTYGAGGTTREGTLELVLNLSKKHPGRVVAHLTCVGSDEEELNRLVRIYKENGMCDILALRGDIPEEMTPEEATAGGFHYASDLVRWLRNQGGLSSIGVACYPEGHPETPDKSRDLDHFAAKVEAGADYAVSQFFFESALWESFSERCERLGVMAPLVPGILPIRDVEQVQRFAARCGATVPAGVVSELAPLKDDPEGFKEKSADLAATQIQAHIASGVRHFHIYALNRSDIVLKIADRMGWRK